MTASDPSKIDSGREAYRKFYDTELSKLLSAIWGGSLHMGLFSEPGEPLPVAQERLKSCLARAAALKAGQRVMEAACGEGATALYLARNYDVHVHATNISEAQLAEAGSRARAEGLADKVSFAFADYHDLGGPPDLYDCWVCQEALLYAADRARVFSEARRVVRPGGRIVFTDLTLSKALPIDERRAFGVDIRAPHLWAIEDYDRLLSEMDFSVLERHDWTPHAALTFAAVARNLAAVRGDFASRIGEESVRGTEFRIARQLEMARAGHLGWCFFALEV
jgi:sarcosine/dimethylglycine N-methyltransferase